MSSAARLRSTVACALAYPDLRRLVLHRRDDPILEELIGTVLRLLRHGEIHVCRIEIGLRLRVRVARVTRVELHQQIARLDESSCLDRHRDDLTRGFRLHLDDVDRLDDSGRFRL